MTVAVLKSPAGHAKHPGVLQAERVLEAAQAALDAQRAICDQLQAVKTEVSQEVHDADQALEAARQAVGKAPGRASTDALSEAIRRANEARQRLAAIDGEIVSAAHADCDQRAAALSAAEHSLNRERISAAVVDLMVPADQEFVRLINGAEAALQACERARQSLRRMPGVDSFDTSWLNSSLLARVVPSGLYQLMMRRIEQKTPGLDDPVAAYLPKFNISPDVIG